MLEIFQYDFMIRAFIAGIAVAIIAPLIGTFLVVRRYSLMADTLAHVALLGVAIGFLLHIHPLLTAVITSVGAGLGMEKLRKHKKLSGDSILALFLSGSLAIAVVLISVSRGFTVNLFSFLFGSIATVSVSDLYFIVALGLISVLTILGFYKELFLVSLDDEIAKANGIHTDVFNGIIVVLAALSVSLAIKIVGALLIGALMVIPVIAGLIVSYFFGWASGGTIVIITISIFLCSLLFGKTKKT